jgi:tRNA pseudouridine38-40 synthase
VRYLISFSYDGKNFSGFQRGTGERSVEDEILEILKKKEVGNHLRTCSRTDRNVSAFMNTLTLESNLKPTDIMGILNSNTRDIYFTGYAEVDPNFNVRSALWKEYVYVLPLMKPFDSIDIEDLKKFEGFHDFRKFCRFNGRDMSRTIMEIREEWSDGDRLISIKARGFLWNQIRFILGFGMERQLFPKTPMDPFSTEYIKRRLAPPQLLFLREIKYENVKFELFMNKSIRKRMEEQFLSSRSSDYLMRSFFKILR